MENNSIFRALISVIYEVCVIWCSLTEILVLSLICSKSNPVAVTVGIVNSRCGLPSSEISDSVLKIFLNLPKG